MIPRLSPPGTQVWFLDGSKVMFGELRFFDSRAESFDAAIDAPNGTHPVKQCDMFLTENEVFERLEKLAADRARYWLQARTEARRWKKRQSKTQGASHEQSA